MLGAALALPLAVVSCEPTGEGAARGAAIGGAAGILKGAVDDKEGNVIKSGAIGAGIGAATGAVIGKRNENNNGYNY